MLLTIKDLAKQLQIKPSTLYAWVAQGKIPSRKTHGLVRFNPVEIDRWMALFVNGPASPVPAFQHGLPQERFYNLLCLAFGSNPTQFADLVGEGYLPATRARNCEYEYKALASAFHKEISPHIDYELAKKIIEANWLPGQVLRPAPQK